MPTALIIEDDPSLRSMLAAMLAREGFTTAESAGADEGIATAHRIRPDVVICDKTLEDGDGFAVLEALRGDPDLNELPFIMMTGLQDSMRPTMNRGADDFLLKPFSKDTLVASVWTQIRKHQQRAVKLADSRARLLSILEASPDFVATMSNDGKLLEVNPAGLGMLRIPAEGQAAPLTIDGIRPATHNPVSNADILAAARERGFWRGESQFKRMDGSILTVSQIIVAHRNPAGRVDFISTTAHEVATDAQRQSSAQLVHRALEWSSNGIAILDASGARCPVIYCNPSFERSFGYPAGEMLRRQPAFLDVIQADADNAAALQAAIAEGTEKRVVIHIRQGGTESAWSEVCVSPVRDWHGSVTHFVAVQYDVTRQKQAERERHMMEVQLREAQKLEAIGQLAAGIAHEINTPTQFIGDNAHFLRTAFADLEPLLVCFKKLAETAAGGGSDSTLWKEASKAAEAADLDYLMREIPLAIAQTAEGVERVAEIVRAMKEFSHPGSAEKTPIDLNHAIESTHVVARNAWKYVADLQLNLDPALPPVPCFPGEINQVILNLIVNAAHAVREAIESGRMKKGLITVSSALAGDCVEVKVSDNGTGIPEAIKPRIFEPHFTTKPIGKGTGYGLALARSVIEERHGGGISFESAPGTPTTFTILLPLAASKRGKDN